MLYHNLDIHKESLYHHVPTDEQAKTAYMNTRSSTDHIYIFHLHVLVWHAFASLRYLWNIPNNGYIWMVVHQYDSSDELKFKNVTGYITALYLKYNCIIHIKKEHYFLAYVHLQNAYHIQDTRTVVYEPFDEVSNFP